MSVSANANAGAFLLFVVAFILTISTTSCAALNITKILEDYPEYSTLSDLFKETKLTGAINKRQTITVLALDNDSIKLISNRPNDEIRNILMNHVVLDYYDRQKIKDMEKKSVLLTTLYQTTGSATDKEGYVNITKTKSGDVVFGSGVKKSPLVSKLLGSVVTKPFNISVLHVSLPIVAPNFGETIEAPPPPPGSSKKSKESDSADAPGPSEDEEGAEEEADAPSPSESDAPAEAPLMETAESPKKKAADETPDDKESDSSRLVWSRVGVAAAIGLVTNLVAC